MFSKNKKTKIDNAELAQNEPTSVTTKKPKKTSKGKNNKKMRTSDGQLLPKTAQQTIPFLNVYSNGLIEPYQGYYTKAYKLNDINFSVATATDQERIYEDYCKFLNTFRPSSRIQVMVHNVNTDEKKILDSLMMPMKQDGKDNYRMELNEMIKEKMHEGKNNISSEKYLIVGESFDDFDRADLAFKNIDINVETGVKTISGNPNEEVRIMSTNERIKHLYDILNLNHENDLPLSAIDLKAAAEKKLSVKDIITASSFRFERNYFRVGDLYCRVLYMKSLPTSLSTIFMQEISDLPINLIASFYLNPYAQDEAVKLASVAHRDIRSNVIEAQKIASKNGYSADMISQDLIDAEQQASFLRDDLKARDQKLYRVTGTILVYGETLDELNNNETAVVTTANRSQVILDKLHFQQEQGFRNVLPLCRNDLFASNSIPLTTECVGLFIPFSTKELSEAGGIYYGINAISKNLILYNRNEAQNPNGIILGKPGSGKSFSAKREMINVMLNTDDDIFIIDPEGEYSHLAESLGGSVIKIMPGNKVYINPFDMDMDYAVDENGNQIDPVTLKSDFICTLVESIMDGRYEMSAIQKGIVDRCVIALYKPYKEHMQNQPKEITCDPSASPTMDDFYEMLMRQPEPEAQNIALSIEIYCRGTADTFSHRTNVEINNRITVYDISNIGKGLKNLGVQICLDNIWNKIISNAKKKKKTWFYIDEFHILTKTRTSSEFIEQIWRRARKWNGVPTAITQNVGDLFKSEAAVTILKTTNFVMLLNQDPVSIYDLAELYKISDSQLSYITNAPKGQGLIYTGSTIVPFVDRFPKETELYKLMSTKAGERII